MEENKEDKSDKTQDEPEDNIKDILEIYFKDFVKAAHYLKKHQPDEYKKFVVKAEKCKKYKEELDQGNEVNR